MLCLFIYNIIRFVVKIDYDYYPQMFLEECKYAVRKKMTMNTINVKLNLDESNDDKSNESDEEKNED